MPTWRSRTSTARKAASTFGARSTCRYRVPPPCTPRRSPIDAPPRSTEARPSSVDESPGNCYAGKKAGGGPRSTTRPNVCSDSVTTGQYEDAPMKILVPLDGSSTAEAALPLAVQLARAENAGLVLLMVTDVHRAPDPAPCEPELVPIHDAQIYLDTIRRHLVPDLEDVMTTVWHGAPAAAIIRG